MSTDPSASSLLDRAKGRDITSITKQGFGAWLLAVSSSAILGVQTVTEFLLFPFTLFIDISDQVMDAFILAPLTVIITGSETTAQAITEFSIFGLPLGTAIVLVTFAMVALYVRRPETSDLIPGTFTDFGGGLIGSDEEEVD